METMTKTDWTERKANQEIPEEIEEQRVLIVVIEKRKTKYLGHVMREGYSIKNILNGKILNEKDKGRLRMQIAGTSEVIEQ